MATVEPQARRGSHLNGKRKGRNDALDFQSLAFERFLGVLVVLGGESGHACL